MPTSLPSYLREPSRHVREFRVGLLCALEHTATNLSFASIGTGFCRTQRSASDLTLQNAACAVRLWKRDDAARLFPAARYDEANPRIEGRRGGFRMGVPA